MTTQCGHLALSHIIDSFMDIHHYKATIWLKRITQLYIQTSKGAFIYLSNMHLYQTIQTTEIILMCIPW